MKASTENKASTGNIFAGFSVAGIEKSREEGGGGQGLGMVLSLSLYYAHRANVILSCCVIL